MQRATNAAAQHQRTELTPPKEGKRKGSCKLHKLSWALTLLTIHARFANQPVATIIVNEGGEETYFFIHAQILSSISDVLAQKLRPYATGEGSKPLSFSNVSSETFDIFTGWIYFLRQSHSSFPYDVIREDSDPARKERHTNHTGAESTGTNGGTFYGLLDSFNSSRNSENDDDQPWYAGLDRRDRICGRFVDLYLFASIYGVDKLKQAVVVSLVHRIQTWGRCPSPTVINHALSKGLSISSRLGRYFVACYAAIYHNKASSRSELATLPSKFLAAVLDVRNTGSSSAHERVCFDPGKPKSGSHGDISRERRKDGRAPLSERSLNSGTTASGPLGDHKRPPKRAADSKWRPHQTFVPK